MKDKVEKKKLFLFLLLTNSNLEKIDRCMEAIDEIRDFFTDPNIDAYLIGAEEGLHLAKVEIMKMRTEEDVMQKLYRENRPETYKYDVSDTAESLKAF